ncbi:MAG: hypothetical protein HQL55_13180 [Magnetococcales bacterium]|nr:hypothetical protein [Magnetococcales bacterium]
MVLHPTHVKQRGADFYKDRCKDWDKLLFIENDTCPGMQYAEISPGHTGIELFVCDMGVGICNNIGNWPPPIEGNCNGNYLKKVAKSKTPLKLLTRCLFTSAVSSKTRPRTDQTTGLQQVGYLLNHNKDFVRLQTGGEWAGECLPWDREAFNGAIRVNSNQGVAAGGTYYGIIIRPGRELPNYPADHWQHSFESSSAPLLFQALYAPPLKSIPASFHCIDQRDEVFEWDFPKDLIPPLETESGKKRIFLREEINTLVWLPGSEVGKRNMLDWMFVIFGHVNAPPGTGFIHNVDRLIIADVERHVGIYMAWFFSRMRTKIGKRLEVFIVTREWAATCLTKESGDFRFKFNDNAARSFLNGGVDDEGSAAFLLRMLRHIDSEMFWKEIDSIPPDAINNVLVKEWVTWFGKDPKLSFQLGGYLDFAQALTNPVCLKVCQRATLRAANTLSTPSSNGQLKLLPIYPTDDLARSVLTRSGRLMDTSQDARSSCDKDSTPIALTSVHITGQTQQQVDNRKDLRIEDRKLAVLRNPHKKGLPEELLEEASIIATALDWHPTPTEDWPTPDAPYCRIPETPFICRSGEKDLPIPRYKKPAPDSKEKRWHPMYGESPPDMYDNWSRLGVLKLGHWTYNNRHDLLTINLEKAYVLDSLNRGSLTRWIQDSLKHYFSDSPSGHPPLARILVYPSHPVTDRIIQDMKNDFQSHHQGSVSNQDRYEKITGWCSHYSVQVFTWSACCLAHPHLSTDRRSIAQRHQT